MAHDKLIELIIEFFTKAHILKVLLVFFSFFGFGYFVFLNIIGKSLFIENFYITHHIIIVSILLSILFSFPIFGFEILFDKIRYKIKLSKKPDLDKNYMEYLVLTTYYLILLMLIFIFMGPFFKSIGISSSGLVPLIYLVFIIMYISLNGFEIIVGYIRKKFQLRKTKR